MKKLQGQKGFTLVELAIVLTIIGLLIGGILKGQQLIDNARVTAQVAQFQGLTAANTTFQDTYGAIAGDMISATKRIPGCGSCADGDGNNVLGAGAANTTAAQVFTKGAAAGSENIWYWAELNGAGLVTGITDMTGTAKFGKGLPTSKIGAGLVVNNMATAPYGGLYVNLVQGLADPGAAAGTNSMTPAQAGQIDRKLDDGNPATGAVIGNGFATNCGTAPAYVESSVTKDCDVDYKIQ